MSLSKLTPSQFKKALYKNEKFKMNPLVNRFIPLQNNFLIFSFAFVELGSKTILYTDQKKNYKKSMIQSGRFTPQS